MNPKVTIEGTVTAVTPPLQVTAKLSKATLIVVTQDKYPQTFEIEAINDKMQELGQYPVGSSVRIEAELRGREYNGKHFTNIQYWKGVCHGAVAPAAQPYNPPQAAQPAPQQPATPFG